MKNLNFKSHSSQSSQNWSQECEEIMQNISLEVLKSRWVRKGSINTGIVLQNEPGNKWLIGFHSN